MRICKNKLNFLFLINNPPTFIKLIISKYILLFNKHKWRRYSLIIDLKPTESFFIIQSNQEVNYKLIKNLM